VGHAVIASTACPAIATTAWQDSDRDHHIFSNRVSARTFA
jgi:hypothetical protein